MKDIALVLLTPHFNEPQGLYIIGIVCLAGLLLLVLDLIYKRDMNNE